MENPTIYLLGTIATVIICIELFIMLLIPLLIAYFSVRGVTWVQRQVQKYGPIVRRYFGQASQITEQMSHKVAAPVIVTSSNYVRLKRIRAALATRLSMKEV